MNFNHYRRIYLNDTDAAGVIYFSNLLKICHQCYEESLLDFGINLSDLVKQSSLAIPIVHSESDFFKPIFWGDKILIKLQTTQINDSEFEIDYLIQRASEIQLAQAKTRHVAININTRKRTKLPVNIINWLRKYINS